MKITHQAKPNMTTRCTVRRQRVTQSNHGRLLNLMLSLIISIAATSSTIANTDYTRLLDDIDIHQQGDCTFISVIFSQRVQYLRHSPLTPGREVAIQVRPFLPGSDSNLQYFRNETLGYPHLENFPLDTVRLEQTYSDIPLLTLSFTREVKSEVRQGHDYRSVDIAIMETDSDRQSSCFQ